MRIISHKDLPLPAGHYSLVTEHQGVLYISGQLPKQPDGSIPEGIAAQTRAVLDKLNLLLAFSGSDRNHVLQVRIYIPDVELWGEVNQVYGEFFGAHRPARCVVPTRELHYGCLIELEAVACVRENDPA